MRAYGNPLPERKKNAPGKELSQGGKGQQPYPGAIGRRRACHSARNSASVVFEASRWLPCQRVRFVVRRIGGAQRRPLPMQTHPIGSFEVSCRLRAGRRLGGLSVGFVSKARHEHQTGHS
jgi:hypothetical protein